MRLLVTGSAGFVGTAFLRSLLREPFVAEIQDLLLLVNHTKPDTSLVEEIGRQTSLTIQQHDLTTEWTIDFPATHILNLAADGHTSPYSETSNTLYESINSHLRKWSERTSVKKIIHVSSGICDYLEYAPHSQILKNNNKLRFAETRIQVEKDLLKNAVERNQQLAILRLYSFVGPSLLRYNNYAVSQFISSALREKIIRIAGNPLTQRSYLHEDEMGKVVAKSVLDENMVGHYSLGSKEPVTMIDLARFIANLTGADVHTVGQQVPIDNYTPHEWPMSLLPREGSRISWRDSVEQTITAKRSELDGDLYKG